MLPDPTPEVPVAFGRYQLLRRIGAGGMGEVFLAREGGACPRAVVVKKVLPELVANRVFVGRFLDEAKVVVRLRHPNIARVYAMGEVAGEYFLSMEYVQGKTVSRFARRLRELGQSLPLGLVLLLGEKVCAGLHHAHLARDAQQRPLELVHRDLSPANVCISYAGEVKIIDFGAAQSTLKEEQTAPRIVVGNLTYMAPEQARKRHVDGRADLYSCGVMLWELVLGLALPQKGDPSERWRKAANPVWDAPSSRRPDLPQDLDGLLLRALRRDPTERYRDAAEFGEALRAARRRHAPHASEGDLGQLLTRTFEQEKLGEDAVLREAVGEPRRAEAGARSGARRVRLAPPTAMAFQHTAVLAPPKADDQDVTDAGQGAPGEVRPPTPRDPGEGEARAEEASFAEEAAGTPGALLLLYTLSFVAAAASGFLVVWWWR
jgi:serine/threonine-protein kinase